MAAPRVEVKEIPYVAKREPVHEVPYRACHDKRERNGALVGLHKQVEDEGYGREAYGDEEPAS